MNEEGLGPYSKYVSNLPPLESSDSIPTSVFYKIIREVDYFTNSIHMQNLIDVYFKHICLNPDNLAMMLMLCASISDRVAYGGRVLDVNSEIDELMRYDADSLSISDTLAIVRICLELNIDIEKKILYLIHRLKNCKFDDRLIITDLENSIDVIEKIYDNDMYSKYFEEIDFQLRRFFPN